MKIKKIDREFIEIEWDEEEEDTDEVPDIDEVEI